MWIFSSLLSLFRKRKFRTPGFKNDEDFYVSVCGGRGMWGFLSRRKLFYHSTLRVFFGDGKGREGLPY